ncbi:DUF3135 domain-containing protein [bacterium]|nr:DUF3135 domain-containing protein [bacterium]
MSSDRPTFSSNYPRGLLPDFDTLSQMAKDDPQGLEELRKTLCNRVIDQAPEAAKPRLRGLMFQLDARRQLAKSNLGACQEISKMMHDSLNRMQNLLLDLRAIQREAMQYDFSQEQKTRFRPRADILPFKAKSTTEHVFR